MESVHNAGYGSGGVMILVFDCIDGSFLCNVLEFCITGFAEQIRRILPETRITSCNALWMSGDHIRGLR